MPSNGMPQEQFTIIYKSGQSGNPVITIKQTNDEIHISSSGLKAVNLVFGDNKKEKLNNGRSSSSLREALKAYRLQQAHAMGWPAYCIFPDKVLDAILQHQPLSAEALLSINGMSHKRVQKYGAEIIKCCKQYAGAQQEEAGVRAERRRWR